MPERLPRDGASGPVQDRRDVTERRRFGEQVLSGDAHIRDLNVGLLDCALRNLPLDRFRPISLRVSLGALFEHKSLDFCIVGVSSPDDDEVGDVAEADPPLGAVEHVVITVASSRRFQCDGI